MIERPTPNAAADAADKVSISDMSDERAIRCTLMVSADIIDASVDDAGEIANRSLYRGNEAAQGWLALSTGASYRLSSGFAQRFGALDKSALAGGADTFEIVSIGPGDGKKDVVVAAHVLENPARCIDNYLAVDISELLLFRTLRNMLREYPSLRQGALSLFVADITDARTMAAIDAEPFSGRRLHLFLGNTLGNLPDDLGFLRNLARSLRVGDRLLIEFRVAQDAMPPSDGDPLLRKQWQFQPLRNLGIPFDNERFSYTYDHDQNSIPETRIRKTYYRSPSGEPIHLLTVRYYDVAKMREYAKDVLGLTVFAHMADDCAALLLLGR